MSRGYFFICLALGMINAFSTVDEGAGYLVIIGSNVAILLLTVVLDRFSTRTHENVNEMIYEYIDLITPERRDELMDDLKKRTGLPIHPIEIHNINFLRDTARVNVFYHAKDNESRAAMTGDDDEYVLYELVLLNKIIFLR
jgi:hypothetical protein